MIVTINKHELSDEEKDNILRLIDERRGKETKDQIEKLNDTKKEIEELGIKLSTLRDEHQVNESIINDQQTLIKEKQSILEQLESDLLKVKKEIDKHNTEIREQEVSSRQTNLEQESKLQVLLTSTKTAELTYSRMIEESNKKLLAIIAKSEEMKIKLEQQAFLDKLSKGHWLRQIQALLEEKGLKVDLLKELNK